MPSADFPKFLDKACRVTSDQVIKNVRMFWYLILLAILFFFHMLACVYVLIDLVKFESSFNCLSFASENFWMEYPQRPALGTSVIEVE